MKRSTSSAAPTAAGGSSSSTRCSTARSGDEIHDGILGCHCCIFPVVDGIPVLHLLPARRRPRASRSRPAGRTWRAATMFGLDDDGAGRARSTRSPSSDTATYRDIVEALGPNFEGGYFLYRFSDPTYIVANAVVRAVGRHGAAAARGARSTSAAARATSRGRCSTCRRRRRCSPTCTSRRSGWRAASRRPGCEPVCCDGNAPMPFARGAFGFAMCTDAFMYIWTKRQFVGEMARLIDGGGDDAGRRRSSATRTTSAPGARRTASRCRRRAIATCSRRSSRGSSAKPACSRTSSRGGPLDLSRRDAPDDARRRSGADDHRHAAPAACSRRIRCRRRRPPPASSGSTRSTPSKPTASGSACGSRSRPTTTRRSTAPAGSICRRKLTLDRSAVASLQTGVVGRRAERSGPAEGDRRPAEAVLLTLAPMRHRRHAMPLPAAPGARGARAHFTDPGKSGAACWSRSRGPTAPGKTTQRKLFKTWLKSEGYDVVTTKWNSSDLIKPIIKSRKAVRALSPEEFSLLHGADFRHRVEQVILPALWDGKLVIADRFLFTGLARDVARGLDLDWVLKLYQPLLWPDLVFYFAVSPVDLRASASRRRACRTSTKPARTSPTSTTRSRATSGSSRA